MMVYVPDSDFQGFCSDSYAFARKRYRKRLRDRKQLAALEERKRALADLADVFYSAHMDALGRCVFTTWCMARWHGARGSAVGATAAMD